jgi:hypothetical protein
MAKQEALSSVIAFEALPVATASEPFMYNNAGLGKPFLLLNQLVQNTHKLIYKKGIDTYGYRLIGCTRHKKIPLDNYQEVW